MIHSSQWVNQTLDLSAFEAKMEAQALSDLIWAIQMSAIPLAALAFAFWWSREEKPFGLSDEDVIEAELID